MASVRDFLAAHPQLLYGFITLIVTAMLPRDTPIDRWLRVRYPRVRGLLELVRATGLTADTATKALYVIATGQEMRLVSTAPPPLVPPLEPRPTPLPYDSKHSGTEPSDEAPPSPTGRRS